LPATGQADNEADRRVREWKMNYVKFGLFVVLAVSAYFTWRYNQDVPQVTPIHVIHQKE
jgi:predicted negative regulator of RcsB-dependent stress response